MSFMQPKNSIIICGSKGYGKSLDEIVDSFGEIVRNNMLVSNMGYGKRESDLQILNCHVYDRRNQDDLSEYLKFTSEEVIKSFQSYVKTAKSQYKTFINNNTNLMKQLISKHSIPVTLTQEIRCGLSYVAQAVAANLYPYMIGFSLTEQENTRHKVNHLALNASSHKIDVEIQLIIELHNKNLIDATLCAMMDTEDMELDCSVIQPKQYSIELLVDLCGQVTLHNPQAPITLSKGYEVSQGDSIVITPAKADAK